MRFSLASSSSANRCDSLSRSCVFGESSLRLSGPPPSPSAERSDGSARSVSIGLGVRLVPRALSAMRRPLGGVRDEGCELLCLTSLLDRDTVDLRLASSGSTAAGLGCLLSGPAVDVCTTAAAKRPVDRTADSASSSATRSVMQE